jgi:pantoate--beta-alanine ligase
VELLETLDALARRLEEARCGGATVGLVPTMGALHAGHRSLIERAADECDVVAVTVFVNPLQFGDAADIAHYPRTLDADVALAAQAGATVVLAPSVTEMYPEWPRPVPTRVVVSGLGEPWEGRSRPGHFDGMATVVAKLFATAGRCRAYFGEKDFQQLAVVRRLVTDLSFPVAVVGCPTVREPDGLALSSRNVRLSAAERRQAVALSAALAAGRTLVEEGERRPAAVAEAMAAAVAGHPAVTLDYAAAVEAGTLAVPEALEPGRPVRLLIAAQVGPVRLIDNLEAVPAAGRTGARRAPAAPVLAGATPA